MAQIDTVTKDLVINCLKESKRLEKTGKLSEALSVLDRISNLHDSPIVSISMPITKQIASLCNQIVIINSSKVSYLKKAEQILMDWLHLANNLKISLHEKIFRLILLTYNNWASIYQNNSKYHMALSYLMKGLQIIDEREIIEAESFQYVAKIKLNVSALYSEIHRYDDAIKFAEDSLITLQSELKIRFAAKDFKNMEGKEKKRSEDMIITYVIAFFNIGVAEECIGHRDQMREAFKNAVNIGTSFLDPSNEVLQAAKKALSECSTSKNSTITSLTSRNSIRIPPEMLSERSQKNKACKIPSPLPPSSHKFLKPRRFLNKNHEQHILGRYYSQSELQKIQLRINDQDKLHFISADQYFYKEISKTMNIQGDIKYLKPLDTRGVMHCWDQQTGEKRKISDLRLKKQHRWKSESLNTSELQEKIDRLREEDEENEKRQEVKIKSKMKTKVYKQLLRSLSARKKYVFPQQRLSFKPPIKDVVKKDESIQTPHSDIERNIKDNTEKRSKNVQATKDEIEDLMDKINEEIRLIDVARGVSKEPHPDDFGTKMSDNDCGLAKSTLKGLKNGKTELKFLKSAIGNSIRNTVKKNTSPKPLLRINTLVNFQV
ncbi:hypothetical protein SteCoe_2892 [Stentor coeruleus]|uniref:Uncharacterized protein n=1 Tax=Stentor coeruleus TaxID=5963 RepID=A0A1R2CYC7_9CILI|nr:hypothetical protein SteCoe_2892 [Stentor coeruleus]